MKKTAILFIMLLTALMSRAATLSDYTWAQVCTGCMGTEWYASDEAREVADILLSVQKTNGGWMKNDQFHLLTASELAERQALTGDNGRNAHSCFDNYATTQEMRFLVRVYNGTKEQKYLDAFQKALSLIITAGQNKNGGWGQYWPDTNDVYSYQNYITFNDDLMTNIMKMLQNVYEAKGNFAGLVDDTMKAQCKEAFDKAIECIIRCQVDDNGTKAAWCAQHDPQDFLPTEGRPHELPSVSGSESATLLSYLMTLENPSEELQACITSAITWLDNHKYMEDKYIEDVKDTNGNTIDRRIADRQGSNLWGRFIQIGGESGQAIYNKFYKKLKERGRKRTHHNGLFTYYEYQILEESYDADKAYQPIFAIYSNDYPELFYRHLYNYADTDEKTDIHGQPVATSLTAANRRSYQYLGSWCDNLIRVEYPAWKQKMDAKAAAGEATIYELSTTTHISDDGACWNFDNGFSISNDKNKGYSAGVSNAVKYSVADFTLTLPKGVSLQKLTIYGYSNYDSDAYITKINQTTFAATDYIFPAKVDGVANFVSHTFDFSNSPLTGDVTFGVGGKQCGFILTLYCTSADGLHTITVDKDNTATCKCFKDNKITICKDGRSYSPAGVEQ